MDSRQIQEQETPDHQRVNAAGSNSHPQRTTPCPNHFQDSTTARAVLATVLEIIAVSGNDLNLAYSNSDRRKCPMLKCFHVSATPMEQISHVRSCAEASKGEIQCWTCHKCHEFKKWHTVCNTLKSPVELLRKLSNRKRGSNTSVGEPFPPKRGKMAMNDDLAMPSRQEDHGIQNVWMQEMEDPSFLLNGVASSSNAALELEAKVDNLPVAVQPRSLQTGRPLPTPPSTRDHSWSEHSQNLVAYGDAKAATHALEQLPPYMVSPPNTFDDYQLRNNNTDTLRLGIPPVQYINESSLMESPEDMEADPALWADRTIFGEAQNAQVPLQLLSDVPNTTASAQYASPSEKSASIFSSSFPASRMPDPRAQKQNSWPAQLVYTTDIQPLPAFEHRQRQTWDHVRGLSEQDFPAATASQQETGARASVRRQASFDAGAQDSITVSVPASVIQTDRVPEDEHQPSSRYQHRARRRGAAQGPPNPNNNNHQYEQCALCSTRFGGIPKNRRQHLKRHMTIKHGVGGDAARFRCPRPGCGRSYNRVDNLHGHERKCKPHRPQQQPENDNSPAVAELAAGDVEMPVAVREEGGGGGGPASATAAAGGAGSAAEESGSAGGGGSSFTSHHHHQQQEPGAMETHLAVYGYPMPTQAIHDGWDYHRRAVGLGEAGIRDLAGGRGRTGRRPAIDDDEEEDWSVLMAGVCGGQQHDYDGAEMEAGPPDVAGHDELAPRPLDLPCVSWRA